MMRLFTTLALVAAIAAGASAEKVVFLKNQGADTNDGSSVDAAVKTMGKALTLFGNDGGTLVICGQYHQSANYSNPPKRSGLLTITQEYDGVDYRTVDSESAGYWGLPKGVRYNLGGPTVFRNVTFKQSATTNPFFLLIANGYPVTIDEGCMMEGTFGWTTITNSFTVLGGCQDNQNLINPATFDTNVIVNGGEVMVVGFNRGSAANFNNDKVAKATAHVAINGGVIHNCYLGSVSKDLKSGAVDLTIAGGEFRDKVYIGSKDGVHWLTGNVNVKVTGGDLSGWHTLYVPEKDENSEITVDVSGAGESELMTLSNLKPDMIDKIVSNYKIPEKDFSVGEAFTADNGISLPYRIHVPAVASNAPVVLFLHGLGSRGIDNVYQLSSMGAACLYPIYNHTEESIIIAPQMPTEEQWVADGAYPGSAGFSTSDDMSRYLAAAVELLGHVVEKYSADRKRLYVTGSSNGGGATWSLCARFPEKFAAAIPVAGTGESANAEDIAERLSRTPIWAFHGDRDNALSVEGTRGLVEAIRKVNDDNVKYTEVAGADHHSIWSRAATTPGLAKWMFSQTLDNCNGIEDVAATDGSEIRTGRGRISVKVGEMSTLEIYDLTGRLVNSAAGCGIIDIDGIAPSIYIASLKDRWRSMTVKVAVN